MKTKVVKDWRTKQRTLVITSRRGESFDLRRASWVAKLGFRGLMIPAYHVDSKSGEVTLLYNLEGLSSIKDYVRKYQVGKQDLVTWLCDIAQSYGRCTDGGEGSYWQHSLLFDGQHVYVDANRRLHFVLVPLDGVPFRLDNTPLSLLSMLSDTQHVTYGASDALPLVQSVASYVVGEQDTFSFNTYRAFVRKQCGVVISPGGELLTGVSARTDTSELRTTQMKTGGLNTRQGDSQRVSTRRGCTLRQLRTRAAFRIEEGQPMVIGRGSSSQLRIEGSTDLSRRHAMVELRGGRLYITDLGSSNGTYVGSTRLTPQEPVAMVIPGRFKLSGEEFSVE